MSNVSKRTTWAAVMGAFALIAGCHIETNGSCDRFGNHGVDDSQVAETCGPFCARLIACGQLSASRTDDCLAFCGAELADNEDLTTSACECIVEETCSAVARNACRGAPIPPVDFHAPKPDGGSGTSSTGSSGSNGGTTGATGTTGSTGASGSTGSTGSSLQCIRNQDCAANQDCVSNQCVSRCAASCDCPTGLECGSDRYCHAPAAPSGQSCHADCECPSGKHCVSAVCQ